MPLPRIIGITGRKFNGKDTVGDYLVAHHGYTRISFAEPIKDICKIVFGLDHEQLYGAKKEDNDEYWNISPRVLMQFVGTELFRDGLATIMPHIGKDLWLLVLQRKMELQLRADVSVKFVITDMRFENEAKLVADMGGVKWRIVRPDMRVPGLIDHPSEAGIDALNVDREFLNDNSLASLYDKIECEMHQMRVYRIIDDFARIQLEENALVVLDIDDTLITFGEIKTWWADNLEKYRLLYGNENDANTRLTADWYARASTIPPVLTDKVSLAAFFAECDRKNCKVICLTARHGASKPVTDANMAAVGLAHLPVFFTDGENKGHVLRAIITDQFLPYSAYKDRRIVFVDDQPLNLHNVNNSMSKEYHIQCYKYNKRA